MADDNQYMAKVNTRKRPICVTLICPGATDVKWKFDEDVIVRISSASEAATWMEECMPRYKAFAPDALSYSI